MKRRSKFEFPLSLWGEIIVLLVFALGCGAEKQSVQQLGGSVQAEWEKAPFAVVQTELSPATLFHCEGKGISFFTHLADYGLGGPTHFACRTHAGVKSYGIGEVVDASWVEECWVLVWFAGAKGWTNGDVPWAIYLQHMPSAMRLNAAGFHLRFAGSVGDIVLLPLYGCEKPQQNVSSSSRRSETETLGLKRIETTKWVENLPREPLLRVRYWGGVLREFPLRCQENSSLDRAKDLVAVRQQFEWHSIVDDWKTERLKLAPIAPPLAKAVVDKRFPVTFSKEILKHDFFTSFGPYTGIEGVDSYEATFQQPQDVKEDEALDLSRWGSAPKPNRYLVQSIRFRDEENKPIWPEITWPSTQQTPTGHKLTFGHVQPGTNAVADVKIVPLNPNSQAIIYASSGAAAKQP